MMKERTLNNISDEVGSSKQDTLVNCSNIVRLKRIWAQHFFRVKPYLVRLFFVITSPKFSSNLVQYAKVLKATESINI